MKILITEEQLGLLVSEQYLKPTNNSNSGLDFLFPFEKKYTPKATPISDYKIVDLTIDNIEGGYYNPDTMHNSVMGDSGETMFGMDRKHGSSFTNTPDGKRFWALIDEDKKKNPKKWVYNYKLEDNQKLAQNLKTIIANNFLKPNLESLSSKYLTPDTIKIVNSDPKLKYHMGYGVWNGEGWFRRFAKKLNDAVRSGVTEISKLHDIALNSRLSSGNKLIAQGGNKIKNTIFPNLT